MRVNIVCRNWESDRVLPRFARHLAERNGWALSKRCAAGYDVNYLMAYFELQLNEKFDGRMASYFTHMEKDPASAKVKLYNRVASTVWLRIGMNQGQLPHLRRYGQSAALPLPLERDYFRLRGDNSRGTPIIGFSGYTYRTGRKRTDLVQRLMRDFAGRATFKASGRGWPCPTRMYRWEEMSDFFRSLDLYVCTSEAEGAPMTTLEAMACGVPVVIPAEVGIHPQIPDAKGVYRYPVGNYKALKGAVRDAVRNLGKHDRAAIRKATRPHSVQAFCDSNRQLFEHVLYDKPRIPTLPPWKGKAGVYVVAFGQPARNCAKKCIRSVQKYMKVPVALCSDRALGPEDILVARADADIGGRKAKLHAYDYAPKQWEYVLYLDADAYATKPDPTFYFDLLADGWEFVICKDAHLHDTVQHFQRRTNVPETHELIAKLGTKEALLINGGAFAFRRNKRTAAFFKHWFNEWDRHAGRDQGALLNALYANPLRTYWLCNEWNTLITLKGHEYPPRRKGSAGIIHEVGEARRWEGQISGRIDGPQAWERVRQWQSRYGKDGRRHPQKRKKKVKA